MTSQPFDAEMPAFISKSRRAVSEPWDADWPLARQRQAWEDQCRRARARGRSG